MALAAPTAAAESWDGPDKRVDFVTGFGVAASGSITAYALDLDPGERALVGGALGVLAGLGKEGLDALGLGDPSAPDLVWTACGALVGAGIVWLFDAFTHD